MEINNTPNVVYNIDGNQEEIAILCDALGSKTRLKILEYIQNPPNIFSMLQISKDLKIPMTTLVHHIKKMEKPNLLGHYIKILNTAH